MYLLARYVFDDLGYRRYEWKCDALNDPSRRAALRLGFTFEGIFRQHMIVKGKNRDTAWYSMLDGEWPERKQAFEEWLTPANFTPEGRQRTSLANMVRLIGKADRAPGDKTTRRALPPGATIPGRRRHRDDPVAIVVAVRGIAGQTLVRLSNDRLPPHFRLSDESDGGDRARGWRNRFRK
jgi:hypothetical protein